MEQEEKDVLTIWRWIREHGGEFVYKKNYPTQVILLVGEMPIHKEFSSTSECAKWVKQQRKEAKDEGN